MISGASGGGTDMSPGRGRRADFPAFYDDVEVYTSQLSYRVGDTVELHVSSLTDRVSIVVERWGARRETVLRLDEVPATFFPPPVDADAYGCGWPVTHTISVPLKWKSGFYLVTCHAIGAQRGLDVAHAGFVVRPDRPQHKRLLVLGTNTWNAYNPWGGASLYTGRRTVSFRRPFARGMLERPEMERDDRKSRPTRWGELAEIDGETFTAWRLRNGYSAAVGSAGWFTFERRFVEWAERAGYEFDYAISSDLDGEISEASSALDGYRQVICVGHDEYWSAPQRFAVERHVKIGGSLVCLSGNTMFWQVRLTGGGEPRHDPQSRMVCFKYTAHDDDPVIGTVDQRLMTGMWADPLVGRPENALLGAGSAWGLYARFGEAVKWGSGAFTVYRPDHWMFAGTGLGYGDLLGARDQVVGYETMGCKIALDDYQLPVAAGGDGSPADRDPKLMSVVAFTPSSNLAMGEYPSSISAISDQGDLEFVASRLDGVVNEETLLRRRIGNAVIVECWPYGHQRGRVVTVGTTDWVFGLARDAQVGQVTRNILDHI